MITFFNNYIFTLCIVSIYGLIGGFAVIPFRHYVKYSLFTAPMAGMLLWSMGVFLFYSFCKFSVGMSSSIIAILGITVTIISLLRVKPKIDWHELSYLLPFIIVFAAFLTYLTNYTSIQLSNNGFLFREGSDQLGYSAMADWLNNNFVYNRPIADPNLPYQSFPSSLFDGDARFGSFFGLAIISKILNLPSMFAFDNACTIVLLTGYLAVTAVYTRSIKTFYIVFIALFFNFWFILSRTGYLGKIMCFPSILFIMGLFLSIQNNNRTKDYLIIVCLLLLTFAASMVFPGSVLSLFIFVVGGLFILFQFLNMKNFDLNSCIANAGILLLMIFIGFSSFGAFVVPKNQSLLLTYNSVPLDWFTILLYQLDLRLLAYDLVVPWYDTTIQHIFLILAFVIMIIFLICTLFKRNTIAASLIAAPLILVTSGYLFSLTWFAYELSSTLFALSVCSYAQFTDSCLQEQKTITNTSLIYISTFLMFLAIALRIPSYIETLHRYVFAGVPSSTQYSQQEINQVAKIIENKPVIIDIPNIMYSLPILVELGRRDNMKLQWSPDSWKSILGYRPDWHSPKITETPYILSTKSDVIKVLGFTPRSRSECHVLAETRQYNLFECPKINSKMLPYTYSQQIISKK